MNYEHYDMGNYDLYIIPTKKFKTITLSMHFRREDTKEDVVYSSLLRKVLLSGNNDYKTLNEYNRARMNLYNPTIRLTTTTYGKDRTITLNGQFPNEKYTEENMNQKSIKFILDTLYNPKVQDSKFNKEIFEIAKHDYIETLKGIKDIPTSYSKIRLQEEMNTSMFDILKIEDLIKCAQSIDEKKLYKYYQSIFEEDSLDVFIIGDFNSQTIKTLLSSSIKGNFKKKEQNRAITHETVRKDPKEIIETAQTAQSKLAIGLKFKDLTDFEYKYVSNVYIGILGGSWNSKLMQVVREEKSLCYTIYATRDISTCSAYIYAGIDADKFEETYELIKEQTNAIENGNFSEDDMKYVKQIYHNSLTEIEDNQIAIMNNLVSEKLSNTDNIDQRRQLIDKVTKKDIMEFAKKVNYEIVYLLKGVLENE